MTSSLENLVTMVPWISRRPFADSWISETFDETVTIVLQKSLSGAPLPEPETEPLPFPFVNSAFFNEPQAQTPTSSSISGSDPGTAPKRRVATSTATAATAATGKIAKRKSRTSKRIHTTTFISADPANFRQMVQQVTGLRFGGGQMPVAPLVKPEPQRPGNRPQGCLLPTLDTSAFLLDQQQQPHAPLPLPFPLADGGGSSAFDGFGGFPTLESWKVL